MIEASKDRLAVIDLPGGEVVWGTTAVKKFPNIDLEATPYLAIDLAAVSDGFGIKLDGGKSRPKTTVFQTKEPGLVVVDIREATGWQEPAGNLLIMLYARGAESRIELRSLKFAASLTKDERAALEASAAAAPPDIPHAGLLHQAARQGDKPACADPMEGERSVYLDPVSGHEIWRMTDHPAIERHVYYDIPAWNADGSLIFWLSRRPGGNRYWLMNADGAVLRPLPPPADGGQCRNPFWSLRHPHLMYFGRAENNRLTVLTLDVRDGKVAEAVSAPAPESAAKDRPPEFCPPHPDERHFLFRFGGHGGFSLTTGNYHVADAPRSGPYGNLVYVTEIANGDVTPIAYHGSSYSGWGSGVPDPEATHPAPICSPDETKIIYDSDAIGQPDIWVAVWKRPAPPRNVRFHQGSLTWEAPLLHREIAGYNILRKTEGRWKVVEERVAAARLDRLPVGEYAVAAEEWSGLESPWIAANSGEIVHDTDPPAAPTAPRLVETGPTHAILEWEPSPDKDLSHYNVYALLAPDGDADRSTLAGSPKSPRFVDWGLSPGDTFHYRIAAVDRQGNESPVSSAVPVSIRP